MKLRVLAALLLLSVACSQKEPFQETECGDLSVCSFSVCIDEDGKISIGEQTGGEFPCLWEEDDKLAVFNDGIKSFIGYATIQSGAGTGNAKFSCTSIDEGSSVRIAYPSSENLYGNMSLSTIQKKCNFVGYSDVINISSSGGNNFTLKHIPAYIRVNIDGSDWDGYVLDSLRFRARSKSLSGYFTFDFEQNQAIPNGDNQDYVTLVPKNFEISSKSRDIWLSVLPDDLTGSLVEVAVYLHGTDGTPYVSTVKFSGKSLYSGKAYSLNIVDLKADIYAKHADKSLPRYTYVRPQYKRTYDGTWLTASNTRTVDGMNHIDRYATDDALDRWGGLKGVKPDEILSTNPEGYWRVGRYRGRNVMVDPDGNIAFLCGMNGVQPAPIKAAQSKATDKIYNNTFSSEEKWAQWAGKLLSDYDFNFCTSGPSRIRNYRTGGSAGHGITAACEPYLYNFYQNKTVSHIENAYLLRTFLWDYYSITKKSFSTDEASVFALMFDPDYLTYIDALAKDAANLWKDDVNFIGWYTDNELQFRWADESKKCIRLADFLSLGSVSSSKAKRCYPYAYKYACDFMKDKYGVEAKAENITAEMDEAFLYDVTEYYYKTVTAALKKYDPNHLMMGSRLHGKPLNLEAVVKTCAKYNDVVSINCYSTWTPSYYSQRLWLGDKPFMISEFYTCGADASYSGYSYNNAGEGGGWIVETQDVRGQEYQNICIQLLEYPTCIGWQWFQLTDDYQGSRSDGKDENWKNKGVVTPTYQPYKCMDYMKSLHQNVYQIMYSFQEN